MKIMLIQEKQNPKFTLRNCVYTSGKFFASNGRSSIWYMVLPHISCSLGFTDCCFEDSPSHIAA